MYYKSLIDDIKSTSNKPTTTVLTDKYKGTAMGSFIGGGVGLAIAYQRQGNLLVGIFLGGLTGGILTNLIIDKQFISN